MIDLPDLDRLRKALEEALEGPDGEQVWERLRAVEVPYQGMTIGELAELQELEETLEPLYELRARPLATPEA